MASSQYKFKKITTVHTADEFVNIMLSRVQRKTPTIVRRHFIISRIRKFYIVKVRYIQGQIVERFTMILEEFPRIDELHPFYSELFNTIYNKEHYKIALGQVNTASHLVNKVGSDYAKLIKYGTSLYRCKQLKKAALGRMVTIIRKQAPVFVFLEEVRQHLSRLPTIDPNDRTILLCGCPNAGKSSFMNHVTRAAVEIQPYAFTTKSIYVGHMDYEFLRWQVIDTPGILDRPFDEMNTIELQAVTALTHIKSAIIFFLDISEQCDVTIANQLKIFDSIRPLFADKPMFVACNKTDIVTLDQLAVTQPEQRAAIQKLEDAGVPLFQVSTLTKEGVMALRNAACDKLLAHRVDAKLHSRKVEGIMNRVYVAMPQSDGKARPAFMPAKIAAFQQQKKYISKITDDNPEAQFEKDIEEKEGFDYQVDYCKNKDLDNNEWKYDKIPRFWNGKNVCDFVDANIERKLSTLLVEEEDRREAGFYDSDDSEDTEQDKDFRRLASKIRDTIVVNAIRKRISKGHCMVPIKRTLKPRERERSTSKLRTRFESLGVNMKDTKDAAFTKTMKRGRSLSRTPADSVKKLKLSESRSRSASRLPRDEIGVPDPAKRVELKKRMMKALRKKQIKGAQTESDRHVFDLKPKHLMTGKRGIGKTDRR